MVTQPFPFECEPKITKWKKSKDKLELLRYDTFIALETLIGKLIGARNDLCINILGNTQAAKDTLQKIKKEDLISTAIGLLEAWEKEAVARRKGKKPGSGEDL